MNVFPPISINSAKNNVNSPSKTRKAIIAASIMLALTATAVFSLGVAADSVRNAFMAGFYSGPNAEAAPLATALPNSNAQLNLTAPPAAALSGTRSGHTATALGNGTVLITGGDSGGSSEIYDPATDSSVAAGNLNAARSGHTATLLSDGRVLVTGGSVSGAAVNTTDIYDPGTGTFATGPLMGTARSGHTATTLANGNVLITGGGTDTAEVFNGTSFTAAGTLTQSRTNHSAALMNDGRVFIAGGSASDTAEIYNPADGTSVATGNNMAHQRSRAHLRVLPDGKVQIIGGNGDMSMEVYDPAVDTIGAHAHLIPVNDDHTALMASDILGSQGRASFFHNGQADPLFDRENHTITELGSQALVAGGSDSSGNALGTNSLYNSSDATVTTDKLDYAPGETAVISGTGWQAGETVDVILHEDPHTITERRQTATADANGNFRANYLVEARDLNVTFIIGAKGITSGRTAQTTFTDAQVQNVTVGPQSPNPLPSGGAATYLVTVNFNGNNANPCTANLTLNQLTPPTWPVGATISFSPSSVTSATSATSTLTIGTPAGTATGTYRFTVTATGTANCQNQNPATSTPSTNLVVGAAIATTTTVASSTNPSVFGQSITLTSTVSRTGTGSPTGSVQFVVDSVNFGSPVALTPALTNTSTAAVSTAALSVGTHTVSATYVPTGGFSGSSGSLSGGQVVSKASTSTTITSDHLNPLSWTQLSPTGTGPSSSTCGQSTNADGAGRIIVYARTVCGGGTGQVWVLNNANGLAGSPTWSLVASGGPSRHAQTVTYDQTTNRLILFGGCSGGCLPVNNDVWVLTNANGQGGAAVWTQMTGITGGPPAARNNATGAYDPATNRLIIYGGQNGAGTVVGNSFSDVWVLSNANTAGGSHTWTLLVTSGTFPKGVYIARSFYDSFNNRFTVAGGLRSDIEGVASSAVNVLTNANGSGGAPVWTNLIAEGAVGAPAFAGWNVDYNSADNRGIIAQQSTSNLYYLNNANGLGGTTSYSLITPSGGGGATPGYGLAFDAPTARTMAWHLNGSTNTSFVLAPASSSTYGESVTFTANVAVSAPGAGTPSGNVQFYDGATPLGAPQPISGGAASIATAALNAGVHNITAQYIGNTNFNASTSGILPHTVAQKTLTATVSAANKVYDGSDAATINSCTVAVVESGDTVTCSAAGPNTFNNKNVGTGKTVTATNISLGGAAAANYVLSSTSAATTANITARAITVSAATNTKVYDGTTSAAAIPTVTVGTIAAGDTAAFTESYTTKTAGTGKTLVPAGSVTDGNSGNNYAVTFANNLTGVITAKPITVNATGVNKIYDGNTSATVTLSIPTGIVSGDVVTAAYTTATFANKNVANGKTVSVSGISLAGADALNYSANTTATATANITPRDLTVTAAGVNKTYDATVNAAVNLSDNRLSGDVFTATYASAVFADKNVSLAKAITVSGISISGTDAGNYNLTSTTASASADVTPRTLAVTATGINKTYDGNNSATVTLADDRIAGDVFTANYTSAAFTDPNAGTAKTVNVTDISLTGTDAGNYSPNTSTTTTANILTKSVTVTLAAGDKEYDGSTTEPEANMSCSFAGVIAGDTANVSCTPSAGTFNTKDVSTANLVTATVTLSGTASSNYTLGSNGTSVTSTTATDAANITPRTLTALIIGNPTKPYDGTTTATLTPANFSLATLVSGEGFTVTQTAGSYNDANVALATIVSAALAVGDFSANPGTLASNYSLPTTASGAGQIVRASTTTVVTFEAEPYTYRGTAFTATALVTGPGSLSESVSVGYTGDCINVTVADGCTASATYAESANYLTSTDTKSITISKADTTTAITCPTNVTYTGAAQEPCSAAATGAGALNVSVTVVYANNTNAGTATADATYGGDANHNGSTATQVSFTIDKADSTTAITCPTNVTYTGAAQEPCSAAATGAGALNVSVTVVYANNTNAGTATADATYGGDANHNGSSATQVAFTINKADAVCTINGYTGVYDAASHGATGSCAGVTGDPTAAGSSLNLGATFTDYPGGTASWTFTGGTNYNDQNGTAAIAINKADAIVTVNGYTGTYDAAAHGATGTATGVAAVDLSAGLNLGATFTDYPGGTANWTFTGGTNYNDQNGTAAIVINKADAVVTITPYSGTYDALAHGLTGTATGVGSVDLSSGLNFGASFTDVPGGTATWTFEGGPNYLDETGTADITITQAISATVVTFEAGPYTYRGTAFTATANVTGVGTLNQSVPVVYSGECTNVTITNGCTAAANFAGDTNHQSSGDIKSITITKAASMTTIDCSPGSFVYTGGAITPCAASVTGANLVTTATVTYGSNIVVGTATADATYGGDANHNGSNAAQVGFTITPAPTTTVVTCTPDSLVYTGSPITPCSVSVSGASLLLAPSPSYTDNVNVGTATASYNYPGDANHTGGSGSDTFDITPASSTTTITCPVSVIYTGVAQTPCTAAATGAGALNVSVAVVYANNTNVGTATADATFAGDLNHTGSTAAQATFMISPATPTVNVTGGTFTYDANSHAASATATGVPSGSVSGSFAFTYTPPGSAAAPVNAGMYNVVANFTSTDPNYTNATGSGSIMISKAPTTTAVTCPITLVYSGFAQTPCTVSVKRTGPPVVEILTPAPTYSANKNVGTAAASYSYAGDTNHNASNGSANFEITKAALTIKANDQSKIFGTTFTFAGTEFTALTLLGTDTVTSGTITSTGSPAGALAGNHPIVISNAVGSGLGNYMIQYVNGTLSITGYVFDGFRSPIDNSTIALRVWNTVNAGQAIPAKWRLTLNGIPVSAASSFVNLNSFLVSCTSGAGNIDTAIEEVASGNSGLIYNNDGNWQYNWKTPKNYANQCRAMFVQFNDGSQSQIVYFKFK